MSDHNTEVKHNEAESRFEIFVDGELAGFAAYRPHEGFRNFNHTVVAPEFRGQGLSKPLISTALDSTRAEDLKVHAACPAVAKFIDSNPEYKDLLV